MNSLFEVNQILLNLNVSTNKIPNTIYFSLHINQSEHMRDGWLSGIDKITGPEKGKYNPYQISLIPLHFPCAKAQENR